MEWIKLTKNERKTREEPIVSVGSGDQLYLNQFVMTNCFKDTKTVVLLHNLGLQKLGIQAAHPGDKDAYRIIYTNRPGSTVVISCRAVIRKLGLCDKGKLVFRGNWDSKTRILEVSLRSPEESKRKKATRA